MRLRATLDAQPARRSEGMTVQRPPVPFDAPAGYEWVVQRDDHWSTNGELLAGRGCRYFVGGAARGVPKRGCGRPSVAVMFRRHGGGTRRVPWAYCERHLYGRWIEDGQVVGWRMRATSDATSTKETPDA
jgi:hypothetical protein